MSTIFSFIKHTVSAMIKGFFITGIVAAVVCFGVLLLISPTHSLANGLTTVFAGVIAVLAAFLGSAVALIYHLSHIEEISHSIKRAHERLEAERQQARKR